MIRFGTEPGSGRRAFAAATVTAAACAAILAANPHAAWAAEPLTYAAVSGRETALEAEFQRRLVLEQRFINEHRLDTIRHRLARGAVPLCPGSTFNDYGLRVAHNAQFAAADRPVAREGFGFDDRLRVQHVVPGSPAKLAGLRLDDAIIAANGRTIPHGESASAAYDAAVRSGRLVLVVERERVGRVVPRRIETTRRQVAVCAFDVSLDRAEAVGATTSERGISVTNGMMWFARDDELAFVIAHELAHVIGNHAQLVRRGVSQAEVELAADYVGIYVMARAGYDVAEVPVFFRRLAANLPRLVNAGPTHPAMSTRYVAISKAAAELRRKIAAGAPLVPDVGRNPSKAAALARED